MIVLYKNKKYNWSLFIGHLVIEKLLKAFYARRNRLQPYAPRSHDLKYLANKVGIVLTEEQKELLGNISDFNLNARYDIYKNDFKSKCTKEYVNEQIKNIKEVREWLINVMII